MEKKWKTIMASECSNINSVWDTELANNRNPFEHFDDSGLNDFYKKMRADLVEMFDEAYDRCISFVNHEYDFDISLAINLYAYMTELNMTPREASNDGIWRYIQVKVIPDQINRRWKQDKKINDKRMWKNSWRIYLKTLWWYVYLSYNDSLEYTYELLKNNSSNDISQLVERSGEGFRVEYTREIMKRYGELEVEKHKKDTLSHILMMNNILCARIDPELNGMTVERYVDGLFSRLDL